MIDKNQPAEKLAEDILKAYAEELMKSRAAYYDALEDDSVPDPPLFAPSPKEEKREKVSPGRIISRRRFIALIAALALLMGLTVISSEGLRKQMFNFLQNDKEGHTDLNYIGGQDSEDSEIPEFELGYVPDGYELAETISNEIYREICYLDAENNRIIFSVYRAEDYNASIDNDTLKRKEITINGNQAFLFYDDMDRGVIWQVGDYVFDLLTSSDINEAIKIAEGVRLKE